MKILKTDMYLLLIDEEAKIKEGDYIYVPDSYSTFSDNYSPEKICIKGKETWILKIKKIIAYRKLNSEAEELDLPSLPPFEEDNIEKLALEEVTKISKKQFLSLGTLANIGDGFILGYKAAQAKGKYSLEDMKKAIKMAQKGYDEFGESGFLRHVREHTETEIIQSLSTQQLPKEFVISDKFSTFEENIKNGKYKW